MRASSACLVTLLLLSGALADQISAAQSRQAQVAQLQTFLAEKRAALAADPANPRLYVEVATGLHQIDFVAPDGGSRLAEAEQNYRRAVELAPGSQLATAVLINLSALLLGSPRGPQAALEAAEQAIQLGPTTGLESSPLYAGAFYNKGKALGAMGQADASQVAYLQAVEASRGLAPETFAKAYASLRDLGEDQLEELQAVTTILRERRQGAGEPGSGKAEAEAPERPRRRAREGRSPAAEAEWAWLAGLSPLDESWLYFGLYSALDGQGDADGAWQALVEGNALQRAQLVYDMAGERQLLATLKTVFPPPDEPENPRSPYDRLVMGLEGYPSRLPIFVVGMARSGSTLIEQILASHSQVHGAGEDTPFAPLAPSIMQLLRDFSTAGPGLRATGEKYVAAMRRRARQANATQAVTRVVDKMLRNSWNVGYALLTVPKACFIHADRHPMDTLLSCYAQPFEGRGTPWAWDLSEIGEQIRMTTELLAHWDKIAPGRVLRVRYEELVADQEAVTRRMLAHCGLAWEPGVLAFHKNQRSVHTASLEQVRQRLYRRSVGRWRRYAAQLAPAGEALRPLIQAYEEGLEADGVMARLEAAAPDGQGREGTLLDVGDVLDGRGPVRDMTGVEPDASDHEEL